MHKYMHIHACINIPTHAQTQTHINMNFYILLHKCPYKNKNKTNLEPICGALTGAPMEASGVAEGVVG